MLNAGAMVMGDFTKLRPEEIESQVNVNGLHPIYLAKALLPQMLSRNKRSSIIVTSSGLGTVAVPGVLTYSMCKSFVSFLAKGLAIEVGDKIDCLAFEPGQVKTNLIKFEKPGGISVESAVNGCLRDLGTTSQTYGAFLHDFQTSLTPKFVLQKVLHTVANQVYAR